MTVWYKGEVWKVVAESSSIENGSREYLIKRPGGLLVVPAGRCKKVE